MLPVSSSSSVDSTLSDASSPDPLDPVYRVLRAAVNVASATGAALLGRSKRTVVADLDVSPAIAEALIGLADSVDGPYVSETQNVSDRAASEESGVSRLKPFRDLGIGGVALFPIRPPSADGASADDAIGTLCVVCEQPDECWLTSAAQIEDIAALAYSTLEDRVESHDDTHGAAPKIAHGDLPALFDDAPILCCTLDDQGRLLHVNSELESLSGYERETLPDTRAFVEALLPDHEVRQEAVDFLKEAPARWISLDMHTSCGSTVTTQWMCVVLPGGRRLALGFDDTERKSYENALREERDRFATLFQNLPTPVVHGVPKNDSFIVRTLNPAFESVFDITADELEGRDLHAAIVPVHDRKNAVVINRTVVEKATVRAEVRRIAGGEERDFRVRAALRPGSTGSDSEVYAIYTDITDHKTYERKLRQAKESAEEAARLKSAMLANMSHEVRTPLTAIIGFAEILHASLDAENARFAQTIRRSSHRLMNTLDSVLELSKLDAGAYALRRSDVSVTDHVCETVEMMMPMAENADIDLSVATPDDDVRGRLDSNAVDRILTNLISNAIKFTPGGGAVRVQVSRDEGAATQPVARITVADTGVGIDASFVPHLFEAFRQESDGVGRTHEGAGLGLAITKRLTEMMNGTVHVDSEKGEGTRFTVTLPLDNG
ncbi:hypothetical protein CRI94_04275 [Longibacter salinarum]|uniref:histidine kinase n=1 Tax=Longibacter salinarum TaxID=1850348 RepID=A0A2A8D072_9BACT|nr:PAS domain-containing sensor histidine kinase [Longibacter salinarum]PEN14261.1 hypothetical protein CRI94_04275 [Longibacter salinarum]